MSFWKSNFGSTYQNLPRYLKSLTFLFPWIAKAISMHQNVHWSFYSLPAEFLKNSVKMISSRLHLKFHQISNWQWNRKCIFLTIIPLICLFLRLGCVLCTYVYARWRLEWFVECGHLLDGQQQTIGRRVLIPGVVHKIRSFLYNRKKSFHPRIRS